MAIKKPAILSEAHNGSADSGQSSSPDTSSSNGSMADSLEDQSRHQAATEGAEMIARPAEASSEASLNEDERQTIKNYQDVVNVTPTTMAPEAANRLAETATTPTAKTTNANDSIETTTPTKADIVSGGGDNELQQVARPPLKSALVTSNIANNNNNSSTANHNEIPKERTITQQQQPKQQEEVAKQVPQKGGNNYSGLNLNMTASEMRELIARRKKYDAKKAQMNIRQKYEIIQQM